MNCGTKWNLRVDKSGISCIISTIAGTPSGGTSLISCVKRGQDPLPQPTFQKNTDVKTLKKEAAVKALEKVGIKMVEYKRGPLGQYNVSLAKTRSGDGIMFWFPERAEIKVSTSKKHKQAVLVIKEKSRKVPNQTTARRQSCYLSPTNGEKTESWESFKLRNPNISILGRELKTFIGDGSKFVPKTVHFSTNNYGDKLFHVKGYSETGQTTNCFLIGCDENKHFISALKKCVETVPAAHKELRPKGLSNKAVRQGEWFFDPVSQKKAIKLLTHRKHRHDSYDDVELEFGSSHRAEYAIYGQNGRIAYAVGKITDTRRGYHKPLFLETVCRVVRNNEKKLQNTRNYD